MWGDNAGLPGSPAAKRGGGVRIAAGRGCVSFKRFDVMP